MHIKLSFHGLHSTVLCPKVWASNLPRDLCSSNELQHFTSKRSRVIFERNMFMPLNQHIPPPNPTLKIQFFTYYENSMTVVNGKPQNILKGAQIPRMMHKPYKCALYYRKGGLTLQNLQQEGEGTKCCHHEKNTCLYLY